MSGMTILPPVKSASVEVRYAQPHHASFVVAGELKRSLTLAKLLRDHMGFAPLVGQDYRVTVEALE